MIDRYKEAQQTDRSVVEDINSGIVRNTLEIAVTAGIDQIHL